MALFNRDYDRDFGYQGTNRSRYGADRPGLGYDRDTRDRSGGTWNNLKRNTREFFGMDDRYDRGYRSDRDIDTTYNRGGIGGAGTGYGATNRGDVHTRGGLWNQSGRYDRGMKSRGYDQSYTGYGNTRYGGEYKSREQTDTGDPFGDRQSGTPIRVMEERDRDRGWFGGGRNYDREYGRDYRTGGRYEQEYSSNPMGYDPYDTRGGDTHRLGGRNRELGNRNRGYDRDWF